MLAFTIGLLWTIGDYIIYIISSNASVSLGYDHFTHTEGYRAGRWTPEGMSSDGLEANSNMEKYPLTGSTEWFTHY